MEFLTFRSCNKRRTDATEEGEEGMKRASEREGEGDRRQSGERLHNRIPINQQPKEEGRMGKARKALKGAEREGPCRVTG